MADLQIQFVRRVITAAILACALATPASAQRAVPVGFAPAHQARSYVPTSDSVASEPSYAVPAGALAGAILVGAMGYSLGAADCDGGASQQHMCRQEILIGGAAVGAAIGAIVGHIIQLGEERDARHARAAADSTNAAR